MEKEEENLLPGKMGWNPSRDILDFRNGRR